ncbi:HAD family hydrolase [Lentzea flava]|uniref:Haloacid dehalogenase n=1 Tax=Lentzea flava TaxID=103732 RepID=A0ABQ2UBQ2_9PSEU|nr:HAD hydrolase family protein [Lentzea flava]MCP2197479.1 HAD-superfamily hydrolase, subfamily IIB [Lentzea flava]GGU19961.1 haloacid dehalogenase [Lentzea flava]
MNWRPRLVALDIDGTLTTVGSNDISPAVKAAITRVAEHGTHVVLCTGRSIVGTTPIAPQLPTSLALCANGAVWWNPVSDEILKHTTFEPGPTIKTLQALLPGSVFAVEQTGVGSLSLGEFLPGDLWGVVTPASFDEIAATPTARLVMRWLDHTPAELAFAVRELELPGVSWHVDHTEAWMTVVPPDVTKGRALEELRVSLGIDAEDTLAIGDGSNDVEMLQWAAHGIAMGQAPVTVQEVADEVTATVLEDGAAVALERFFPA